jgi:hypothetical protein
MPQSIQDLIAAGRTEEALAQLAQTDNSALLLQAQYNNGKKQYNLGLIEFSEWSRIQARVAYAALELAGSSAKQNGNGPSPVVQPEPANQPVSQNPPASNMRKVFISYNHADTVQVQKIRETLSANNIEVTIDSEGMRVGERIEDFINRSIASTDFVVSVISKNSLRSGWVSVETKIILTAEGITDKKIIPVSLDESIFNSKFFFKSIDLLDVKINTARANIENSLKRGLSAQAFQEELSRNLDAKNNLSGIFDKLKSILVADISNGNFDVGMKKVINLIKANK